MKHSLIILFSLISFSRCMAQYEAYSHVYPISSDLTIDATMPLSSIELFDGSGRLILARRANAQRIVLPLGILTPGTYVLRLTDAEGRIGHKAVVKD